MVLFMRRQYMGNISLENFMHVGLKKLLFKSFSNITLFGELCSKFVRSFAYYTKD